MTYLLLSLLVHHIFSFSINAKNQDHLSSETRTQMSPSVQTSYAILSSLQRVDPTITSWKTTKHIVQGSAEGFVIEAYTSESCDAKHLFVKYVDPKKYSHKSWADLRRTIHYTRTEVRFYTEILPLLKENIVDGWDVCPLIYLAEYNLKGLMEENESTEAQNPSLSSSSIELGPKYDKNDASALEGRYGIIVMDNAEKANTCFQRAPLRQPMAVAGIKAIAKFHATAFQKEQILTKVSDRLCRYGGSYHLKNRNPNEMLHLISAWEGFVEEITPVAPNGFFDRLKMRDLGKRLHRAAEFISQVLSPSPSDKFATIVHGDYKAMNIFFKGTEEDPSPTPILIDFASTGVGLGVSDVAMHIAHVAIPEDLENGLEDLLVKEYYNSLQEALPDYLKNAYTEGDVIRHYQFAVVDYFRFILGRQWNKATLEVFEKRSMDTNFAMVNRSIDAALSFAERTDRYLSMIEDEMDSLETLSST